MRDVPTSITAAWQSGDFIGDQRPMARVTVQRPQMALYQSTHPVARYVAPVSQSGTPIVSPPPTKRTNTQEYANFLFGPGQGVPKELQNIKSVRWQRGVDIDVATCDIEVWNTEPLPVGAVPLADLDRPGYYTYNYGGTQHSGRWGHVPNEWSRMLMPDNLVRTYEGYGWTPDAIPEKDERLVQTGLWKIIEVDSTAREGVIVLRCEDVGCLLREQIAFPPVVPWDWYPLEFGPLIDETITEYHTSVSTSSGQRVSLKLTKTSNLPWNGDAPINGHAKEHVMDGKSGTYWLSVGNVHPSRNFAYEYVEFAAGGVTLEEVRFKPAKSNYTAYLSVSTDGGSTWHGKTVIGWRSEGVGRNGADVPFVMTLNCTRGEVEYSFKLPKPIPGVTHFRVTLGNLQNFGFGEYKYRGGLREVSAYAQQKIVKNYSTEAPVVPPNAQAGSYPRAYRDYTDIIKLLAAWAGLYWPMSSIRRLSDGTSETYAPARADPVLAAPGRVWGDFEDTGTYGPSNIGVQFWDKKTLLECMAYVRDLIGFIFMIDETGGVVWRLPNLYELGNWVNTLSDAPRRTQEMVVIDEEHTLMDLRATISARNVRERVFVGNSTATVGATSAGWNPNPTGLRRVGGWTDGHFANAAEVTMMADLITLRQMFTYRKDSLRIPANPQIQPDDQVQIFERMTSEGNVHYVQNVSSDNDLSGTGQWTYSLDVHWLGEDPLTRWAFSRTQLARETQQYLTALRWGVAPSQTGVVDPRDGS